MNAAWKQDPRLKTMNQEKLNYLTKLAETVEQTPKDKLMPLFMSMAAGSGQFQFTDSETDLLVSIMTAKMSPAEKKRLKNWEGRKNKRRKGGSIFLLRQRQWKTLPPSFVRKNR